MPAPGARIYDLKREQLGKLLQQIDGPGGATLLIPNLQRPFVWEPHQVTMLMDSLLRGWPFGTLLLWRIDTASSQAMIPSRPFWRVADRTDEQTPTEVSQQHPPAQFTMVLDGQQRMQSLILAVGGDDFGFCLPDAAWHRSVEGQPRKGRQTKHWSKGSLFLDVCAYSDQCAASADPQDLDYQMSLKWVVSDPAGGRSKSRQPATYKYPIPSTVECPGRFVRLSRLWQLADTRRSARALVEPVRQLLVDYGFSVAVLDRYAADVADLVVLLGHVKSADVSYLELQPYNEEIFQKEAYNDAVVNIFTRLNTAGRTLSEQEISYAWIKSYWDPSETGGLQADECFNDLRETLLDDHELKLDDDDIVRVVSTIWSAIQNNGELLSRRDLLQPNRVKPLATGANERWGQYQGAVVWTAARLKAAGLKYGTHYESLNAVVILMAWRAIAEEWTAQHGRTVMMRDEFEKQVGDRFDRQCVRWFAVTQWAEVWAVAAGKSFSMMIADLSHTSAAVLATPDAAAAAAALEDRLDGWLTPLLGKAADAVEGIEVARREQVSQYHFPLWVWHRLDGDRRERSRIMSRDGKKESSIEVDHLVAAKAWEKLLQQLDTEDRAEVGPVGNELGNCWLMEKNFNISKSDSTLVGFLAKVYELKASPHAMADFCRLLDLTQPLLDPVAAVFGSVRDAIQSRTRAIKEELKAFVRGQKVPFV